jgi:23S rRNA G2069 N7-methylase RlmK/C1962 C5-methylase RlmI
MDQVLNPQGRLVLFLNTHQVTNQKFEKTIQDNLKELRLNYKLGTRLSLGQDCPTLKNFPEGSYLKGLLLEKI